MQITLTIREGVASKLNKANARDVKNARAALSHGETHYYASTMACIHRSSSRLQQIEIEFAICEDETQDLFRRVNGCLVPALEMVA